MKKHRLFWAITIALLLVGCRKNIKVTKKSLANDPFKEEIVASQFYEINAKKDTVLEGKNGTLLAFTKDSFIDSYGTIVKGIIQIELAEAFTLGDMVLSNLTTTSGNQLLETDGMIYFNATKEGEQLTVNPASPIRIEIPTTKRKAGMMVYRGIRDRDGNMNWVNPVKLENSLMPVDINSLDFLPYGFAEEVEKGMPFKNHQKATQELIDSLYYSFAFLDESKLIPEQIPDLSVNETFYNSKDVEAGNYIDSLSTNVDGLHKSFGDSIRSPKSIDPAIIKTIKSESFQSTLIATKEFEKRLQVMFKICRSDVIDIYINNLDKKLYEIDSIVALLLEDNRYHDHFQSFAAQRLGSVKGINKNLELLKTFYEERLKTIKDELTNIRNEAVRAKNEEGNKISKALNEYKLLLKKREQYRMETYGFEWTDTGWINIDIGIKPKDWEYTGLEVFVENGNTFERVHTYIIYTSIKSLYRLNSKDKTHFYVGNEDQREMIMPKKEKAVIISVGFKSEQPNIAISEFLTNSTEHLNIKLQPSSTKELDGLLSKYHHYGSENRIDQDLALLKKLNKERVRQEDLKKEWIFMAKLSSKAFPIDSVFMRFYSMYQIDMPACTPYESYFSKDEMVAE